MGLSTTRVATSCAATQELPRNSQEPSTGPYLEPDQFSPYYPILSLQDPSQYYQPTYILVFVVVSF
jgi:hypothetical protein